MSSDAALDHFIRYLGTHEAVPDAHDEELFHERVATAINTYTGLEEAVGPAPYMRSPFAGAVRRLLLVYKKPCEESLHELTNPATSAKKRSTEEHAKVLAL